MIKSGMGAVDGMSDREFDALVAAKILKMVPHIPGHCEHCGGRFSHENICTGCGFVNGPQLATAPRGLEQLDRDEILRLRYSGMLSGDLGEHFLGSDMERTFGEDGGGLRTRWDRVRHQFYGGEYVEALWREAYHEIGRISSWLGLSDQVREEIAYIYTNMRKQGKSSGRHRLLEEVLAKATYLACLVHGLPREREDLEREIRELYGFGIGEIPEEFVKAADFKHIRFGVYKQDGKKYLHTWKLIRGKMTDHKGLGKL